MSNQNIDSQGAWRNATAAAFPFVTSSVYTGGAAKQHTFSGQFGNSVFAKNTSTTGNLYLGFTQAGVQNTFKYFTIKAGETVSFPFTFGSIYVSGSTAVSYSLAVGVTQINTDVNLTGWAALV